MFSRKVFLGVIVLLLAVAGAAGAQTTVTLPDTSQTTTLTASVSEQAQVTVPSGVTFNVTNVASSTAASAASVTVSNIVLATATKQLKVSIQGGAASFTPPVVGATTWAVGDVTWNAATWTNATGASGTLSNSSYTEVATCAADAATCSTTGLVFTLGAKSTVKRSGSHTLSMTWKFESIGT
ncbi:MAG TPA: hypothetical protein VGX68_04555 [Thermoanaerobaculia bacterium]|jgi:hypothetical protein|nr:hypothetical protein [Thermoanaerobaculia bacterium]